YPFGPLDLPGWQTTTPWKPSEEFQKNSQGKPQLRQVLVYSVPAYVRLFFHEVECESVRSFDRSLLETLYRFPPSRWSLLSARACRKGTAATAIDQQPESDFGDSGRLGIHA